MNKRGFTLIELLVVIAIIGLLASIVLTSLTSARVKARDAGRLSAMKEMQKALELYYNDKGHYPYSCGGSSPGDLYPWLSFTYPPESTDLLCITPNGGTKDLSGNNGLGNNFSQEMAPYISKLTDPSAKNTFFGSYLYINTHNANSYCFGDGNAENLNNFPESMISTYLCANWDHGTGQCTAPGPGDPTLPNGTNGVYVGAGFYATSAGC